MGYYSSWISVSDFQLTVKADNEREARDKLMDRLRDIQVYVTEEGHDDEKLSCMITGIDKESY